MTPVLFASDLRSARERRSAPERPLEDAHRQRVLVVEDELMIGAIAAEALEEVGFAVLLAASAEEAEVILAREAVDVLLTDIDLGGRDGWNLARSALRLQPNLRVVFATGCSRRDRRNPALAGVPLLAKPYRLTDMIREVKRAAPGVEHP